MNLLLLVPLTIRTLCVYCSDVLDNEVLIPNYSTVRLDRNGHTGGVAMYIHDSVAYNVLLYGSADLELLVSLSRNNFQLCLSVFYRPPSYHLFLILYAKPYFPYLTPIFLILLFWATLM